MIYPTYYSHFYGPLNSRLRQEGISAIARRNGGWVNRYRSYKGEYPDTRYLLVHDDGAGLAWAGFCVDGDRAILGALLADKEEIERDLGSTVRVSGSAIYLVSEAHFGDPSEKIKATREWMFQSILSLKKAIEVTVHV